MTPRVAPGRIGNGRSGFSAPAAPLDRMKKAKSARPCRGNALEGRSMAQSGRRSETELSKDVENPVTRRVTLPLRYEALRPAGGLHKG